MRFPSATKPSDDSRGRNLTGRRRRTVAGAAEAASGRPNCLPSRTGGGGRTPRLRTSIRARANGAKTQILKALASPTLRSQDYNIVAWREADRPFAPSQVSVFTLPASACNRSHTYWNSTCRQPNQVGAPLSLLAASPNSLPSRTGGVGGRRTLRRLLASLASPIGAKTQTLNPLASPMLRGQDDNTREGVSRTQRAYPELEAAA